jgi:hypothetical protein
MRSLSTKSTKSDILELQIRWTSAVVELAVNEDREFATTMITTMIDSCRNLEKLLILINDYEDESSFGVE